MIYKLRKLSKYRNYPIKCKSKVVVDEEVNICNVAYLECVNGIVFFEKKSQIHFAAKLTHTV
jgi:hypothetical protein